MTKTRSSSTSEPSVHERRSLRLARDVDASGSTKLKRNLVDPDGFVRASPRRKVAKFSSDTESNKKDLVFSPHKYLNTPSKHFTRSSKRMVSSVSLQGANIGCGLPSQSPTRGRKKSSSIADSPALLLPKVEHSSIQPQNLLQRATSLQENGRSVYENGSASPNECKHINNRTLRGRQCQCSIVCFSDRPVTRLSAGREQISNNKLFSFPGMKNLLELKSESDNDCKSNGCQEKDQDGLSSNENSSASPSLCHEAKDRNVSIQEESKEKLDIEELLEIEYSDIANNDFVGYQGKRKMNLRSSGVHCDPNYYAMSLELLKKSRCKSIASTFDGKDGKLEESSENSYNQTPQPKLTENDASPEDRNIFASGETVPTFLPKSPGERSEKEGGRKTDAVNQEEFINGITSSSSQIHIVQDGVGDMCNLAVVEPKNSVTNWSSEDEPNRTSENDITEAPVKCSSENIHSGTEQECSSEQPFEMDRPTVDPTTSPSEDEVCQNETTTQVLPSKQSPSSKRRRGNFKQRTKEGAIEKPKIKMLYRDPDEPPQLFTEEAIPRSDVYYFESDHVALKHNKDYQGLLRTVALLEAQRHQCLHDIESLRLEKNVALNKPVAFVDKLQTGSLKPSSCKPQSVAALPNIEWQKYSSQYGTFSNVFGNDSISNKPVTRNLKLKFESGVPEHSLLTEKETNRTVSAQSTRVTWTVDEQLKLEELLLKFPSESVEFNRFRKIAAALGNRTPLQVQSRVQKYFIKLARAGLPVPGVMPRSSRRARDNIRFGHTKRARTHPQQSYLRASTFFPQLHCPVQMAGDDEDISLPSTSNVGTSNVASEQTSDDEDIPENLRDSEEYNEILLLKKLRKSKLYIPDDSVRETLARHTGYACDMCDSDPIMGVRYHCIDCPQDTCVDLCQSCIHLHGQFVTDTHKPSHRMEPMYESQNFLDGDYMKFDSCSGEYNYLDPNFHPASI